MKAIDYLTADNKYGSLIYYEIGLLDGRSGYLFYNNYTLEVNIIYPPNININKCIEFTMELEVPNPNFIPKEILIRELKIQGFIFPIKQFKKPC